MAKKNIGILLIALLVLLGVAGGAFFLQRKALEPESIQSEGDDSGDQALSSLELMKKKGKPTGSFSVELEYQDDFSMDDLNMTMDDLNQLKTYKMKLCTDEKGYADQADLLLGDYQIAEATEEDEEFKLRGYGEKINYNAADGSWLSVDSYGGIYGGSLQEEVEDVDYEQEIHNYLKALDAGFFGYDGITYSIIGPYTSGSSEFDDARYYIQYCFDGYPLSMSAYSETDGGYTYQWSTWGASIGFRNGVLESAEWLTRKEIYEADRISLQYESMDQICDQMEEALEEYLRLEAPGNYYYIISGVHCVYVLGETEEVGEDGLKEMIVVPFLEYDVLSYYYFATTDTWALTTSHKIGFNLDTGHVAEGVIINPDVSADGSF